MSDRRDFICPSCGKKFLQLTKLLGHQFSVHRTYDKPIIRLRSD